jgi:protoporphyrin/coproporphyrin ferrochelatase
MSGSPIGILAMAYGTATGPDDVERYYTDIRGGRAPSPDLLEELKSRYAAIGNRFPLLEITERQAARLQERLDHDHPGRFRVYLGMKHSSPFVAQGVAEMRADGIERAVGIVLAPHYSTLSVGTYIERVEKSVAEDGGPSFTFVKSWHDHPSYLEVLSSRVADALAKLPVGERDEAMVVFSAHSLPARIVEEGDPYPDQLQETGDLVAVRLGLLNHMTGWQSAGRTPEPWLGPDLSELIEELAGKGYPAVVVCACGFVADHLEILYDLDIEAKREAERAGIAFVRTESMNDDPGFVRALADVIHDHLAGSRGG